MIKKVTRLDANAPTFVPSTKSPLHTPANESSDQSENTSKFRFQNLADDAPSTSGSERSSSEADDPNADYVHLKMQITNLTSQRLSGNNTDSSVLMGLRARLTEVKKHYFFNEKEAEAQFRAKRQKEDALALQSKLRGLSAGSSTPGNAQKPKTSKRPPNIQPPKALATPPLTSDLFDGDSDDSGGMLEILDELPDSEVNEQGTTVTIRDMALPKHWSGRTPKTLLAETVAKTDRYAAISYQIISGSSRAKRAAVHIRWEGRKDGEWRMEDVACHDEIQAEAYIAAVALHALTFPLTDGFQTGSSTASGTQTFFRLLPAVYRDLWDELEAVRKARDDSINRGVWAKLRVIVEPKLETNLKVGSPDGSRASHHLSLL